MQDDEGDAAMDRPYYLGCPVWADDGWEGVVYPPKAPKTSRLKYYSRMFNTAEGNTTFYGLPSDDVVRRWIEQTPSTFRFALKFPQAITHEARLRNAEAETADFLRVLEPIRAAGRLGPSFLQLPPTFSAVDFPSLEAYLQAWSPDYPLAVEARHPDYYAGGSVCDEFEPLLAEAGFDRVLLDSRPLFSAPASTPSERESQRKKPRSPFSAAATGPHPFLRLIGRDDLERVDPWIEEWAPRVVAWIAEGRTPYVFTHTPDPSLSPRLAQRFHAKMRSLLPSLPALPEPPQDEGKSSVGQKLLF